MYDTIIFETMDISAKDKELIQIAEATRYTRWYEIESLIEKAESEETKRRLKSIMVSLYHKEEASEGLL